MNRVTCFIRPHRLEAVKSAIAAVGVTGMTVTDVRGTGSSPETSEWFGGGHDGVVPLPIRAKIEVVASADFTEAVVAAIIENSHTGEAGDGKIFVEAVRDARRIRTQERGLAAV